MSANLMSLARSGGKFLKLFGDRKMMKTMPTARDYVQDGLVFMQDCIENSGWGVHKSGIQTEWTELVSGEKASCDVTFYDDYALVNSDHNIKYNDNTYISQIDRSVALTYEGILENITTFNTPTRNYIFSSENFALMCRNSNGPTTYWHLRSLLGDGNDAVISPPVDGEYCLVRVSVAASADSSKGMVYIKGVHASYADRSISINPKETKSILENLFQGMRIRCFRTYSRVLTADEIAHNYAIDKARFNLPD